jgi:phage shock protein C
LGIILIGVGVLVLLSIVLGPAFGRLLFPLALIVAGAIILMRSRQ